MTQYQDDINNMQAASTRAKVQGTSICFGSDSPVRMPQRQRVAQPEAVRTASQPSLTAVWGVSCDSLSILLGVCCRGDLLQAWSDLTLGAQDVKIASAEEIKSKNSSSHICLGTDSPSLPKRTSSKDSIVPDIPVASPHTLRERTFGGSAVSWDQHGGAELMGNRHAVSAQQTRHSRHSQQHCRRGSFWYVRRFDTLAGGACQPRNARVDF